MPMASNGPVATAIQLDFIEWLVDPERQGSQNDWARAHSVSPSTLCDWKKDPRFKKAWEARCADLNVDPDRIQRLTNKMFEVAMTGDVKAMALYLQYVDRFTPKQEIVGSKGQLAELSDEELALEARAALRVLDGEG